MCTVKATDAFKKIVVHNLMRGLPVVLKIETMQVKLTSVMCGDGSFALVGRYSHVTCPHLSS
jgi:hypothetical protein